MSNDVIKKIIQLLSDKNKEFRLLSNNNTNISSFIDLKNKHVKLKLLKDKCIVQRQKFVSLLNKIKEYEK